MVLKSGELRNYCVVQTATKTSDGQGGFTLVWNTSFSDWFKVTPLSMSRTLDEAGIKYRKAIEFMCRYGNGVSEANRIVYNSDSYTIVSVVPNELLNEIKILAYA